MKKNKSKGSEQEHITWKETWRLNKRAFLLMWKKMPDVMNLTALQAVIQALLPLVDIYASAQIINELAGARRTQALRNWVLLVLGINLAAGLVRVCLQRARNVSQSRQWVLLNEILSEKILSMDFCDVDDAATYEKKSRILQSDQWSGWGLNTTYWLFQDGLPAVISIIGAVSLSVSLFILPVGADAGKLVMLNHPVFLAAFVLMLFGMVLMGPLLSTIHDRMWASCEEQARLGNRIFGYYGYQLYTNNGALDMRLYRQDMIGNHYFMGENQFSTGSAIAKLMRSRKGMLVAGGSLISAAFIGIVYLFVILKCYAGAFPIGSCTQYISAITALSGGLGNLLTQLTKARSNVLFLRRTFEFLDMPNEMYQGTLTVEKRRDRQYEIEFRDVSFHYPNSEIMALRHVNVKFRVGERLAVVGENGSGKTTFIKLLCRLYDPTEGQILLNGIDIRKYDYREYLSVFSVVFQDFQLLAFDLGENVAADRQYDRERARKCLIQAGFGARLDTLPLGLDTTLYKEFKEDGVEMSGGEAQKIAIARALYHDAPFIILDEPTAALDPVAEYEIYSKFNELVEDRTAIYISHRLSSCRFCDEILVFGEGAVLEKGNHEALLAKEGMYYRLWNAQAGFYQG